MTINIRENVDIWAMNLKAAAWMAERFLVDDKREAFRVALLRRLDLDWQRLYNDYDPQDILIEAVRDVIPECQGCFFSGKGIFPNKTGLWKKQDGSGKLVTKEGYAAPLVEI